MTLLNINNFYWNWELKALAFSNVLAILLGITLILIPLVLIVFQARNLQNWNEEEYLKKHGSVLEGTKQTFKTKQWLVLIIPSTHFLRRLVLVLSIIYLADQFWAQMAI